MLTITVPGVEVFNDETQTFDTVGDVELELEHSLISLSKWEAEWNKPFLSAEQKTPEETMGYFRAMTLTPNVPPEVYQRFTDMNVLAINTYVESKMSATWFAELPNTGGPKKKETITSEIIYYWLVAFQLPFECETWHLNRLFTMIKVCNQKNAPEKKMSKQELANRNRALNEQRLKQYGTTG